MSLYYFLGHSVFIRFDSIHERQTDGQTNTAWRHIPRLL